MGVLVVWASAFSVIKALLDHGVGAEQIALARYLVAAPGFFFLLWRAACRASTGGTRAKWASPASSSSPATTSP